MTRWSRLRSECSREMGVPVDDCNCTEYDDGWKGGRHFKAIQDGFEIHFYIDENDMVTTLGMPKVDQDGKIIER